ncbi:MAG: ComF family protein [Myxococcota bacterium]
MRRDQLEGTALTRCLTHARKWTQQLLRHVYPDRCPGCRMRLSREESAQTRGWCAPCAETCFPLESPRCSICATPRPMQIGRVYRGVDARCSRCVDQPPAFEHADSLFEYTGAVADAIQFIKYAPASWPIRILEPTVSAWLGDVIDDLDDPVVTTVPMHRRDLVRRGFHLIEMLLALSSRTDARFETSRLLEKRRFTRPQAGLTLGERLKNVRGAFQVDDPSSVTGRNILLVDDVMTTGATANAASKALIEAGASAVFVATIARAPST